MELLSLGTYLEHNGHEVEVLDGQFLSSKQIVKRLKAQLVGVSANVFSTNALDEIVCAAKQKGISTVVGGQAATPLARQLLSKNRNIDFVIKFDGEHALKLLADKVQGRRISLRKIPNIVFREGPKIIETKTKLVELEKLPIPKRDLKGVKMKNYFRCVWEKQKKAKLPFRYKRLTNMLTKKGCPFRATKNGCSFCARIDMTYRQRTPEQVHEELKYLTEKFKVRGIIEFSDNWIIRHDSKWHDGLCWLLKKEPLPVEYLEVYVRLEDITKETVRRMKNEGVSTALVGIESGNEAILRKNGLKHYSPRRVIKTCQLLEKAGIKIEDSYILGLIGETKKTVQDTIKLSRLVGKYCEQKITFYNLLTPLPGSRVWQELMTFPEFRQKYSQEYKFDVTELQKFHINQLCDLGKNGYGQMVKIKNELVQ